MKKKGWMILTILVLIAVVVFAFWDSIVIRVSPKAALTAALTNTVSALETRLEDSPAAVLSEAADAGGRNTIDFRLDTGNELLGDIRYNMTIQTEGAPRRVYAEGTVTSSASALDLSIYLDKDFAAVSSQSLLEGKFYGITYETFPQDIRSMPLLSLLIGEETIEQWEASVSGLRESMSETYEMPQVSQEDLRAMLVGILTLKAQVSSETLTLNGQERGAYRITFSATGPEIASAAEDYLQDLPPELQELMVRLSSDPNSALSASFYVYEDVVAKLSCELTVQGEVLQLELLLGADAARDDLNIAVIHQTEESLKKWSVDIHTEYDDTRYAEKLDIVQIENGVQDRTVIDYGWDLASGDMLLNLTEGMEDTAIRLNLQSTEDGFRLTTNQFEDLLSAFSDEKKTRNSACTMTVSKGAGITTPEYKNLDQWSADDFLVLLGGLGSLLGLQIR